MPPEVELNKAAMLLTVLGQGNYDYENMTWTPYENGVYTFDVEFFNVEKMYTDLEQLPLNGKTGSLHWRRRCMTTGLM